MTSSLFTDREHNALSRALTALRRRQRDDGHWLFDLEADATITAEYILLEHFMGRVTPERQAAMAVTCVATKPQREADGRCSMAVTSTCLRASRPISH